ncbi:hypothetical protein [Nonlabens ponticola]|uniref:Uncharacterized protein n=1 Tax=Nonlabens ponticola TaxID=2496866 RepID=A0A3S9MUW7_9FLAO|nr:hypothetical protein [Nonlabens ponticola]AZQ42967.1 hypothetical protein EJ995_01465 [Nonlabens ponticola]
MTTTAAEDLKINLLQQVNNKIDDLKPNSAKSTVSWKEKINLTNQLWSSINLLLCDIILDDDSIVSSGNLHAVLQEMEPTINELVITHMVE